MRSRTEISNSRRMKVFERDRFKCRYCGRSSTETVLEIEHIIPYSSGGKNDISNLLTVCRDCNNGKSNRNYDVELQHVIEQETSESNGIFNYHISLNEEEYATLIRIRNYVSDHSENDVTTGEVLHNLMVKSMRGLDGFISLIEG